MCGHVMNARMDQLGKKIRCPKCQSSLRVLADDHAGLDDLRRKKKNRRGKTIVRTTYEWVSKAQRIMGGVHAVAGCVICMLGMGAAIMGLAGARLAVLDNFLRGQDNTGGWFVMAFGGLFVMACGGGTMYTGLVILGRDHLYRARESI